MISYQTNSSSANVVVDRVLDIRPISYDENGSYALPERLKVKYPKKSLPNGPRSSLLVSGKSTEKSGMCYFVRQLGVVLKDGKALIYIQPPGVYLPDFGYGPVTHKINLRPKNIELDGDYKKFPELPRFKTVLERELTENGMPYIELENFDAIQACAVSGVTEKEIENLMDNSNFSAALESVFKSVGFGFTLSVKA